MHDWPTEATLHVLALALVGAVTFMFFHRCFQPKTNRHAAVGPAPGGRTSQRPAA